jgi:membrane AbrB-like protein
MNLVVAIILAVGAAYLLDWLNFPAGALIGAMVAIAALKLWGVELPAVPGGIRFLALIVIGWDLGSKFNKELLAVVADNLLPLVGVVVAFLLVGWILAWTLWKAGLMDPATAVLATSPGGLVQMGALTSEIEANAALVVGFHLLRIVSVLLSVPLISRWAAAG